MKDIKIVFSSTILVLSLLTALTGCQKSGKENISSVFDAFAEPEEQVSAADTSSDTNVSSESSAPAESSTHLSSVTESSASTQEVSIPAIVSESEETLEYETSVPSETVTEPVLSQPESTTSVTPPEFTVNDPDNTRGLSNERIGCYYGVASGGKPHQLSIDNQLRFDGFENVKALALDTVSKDNGMYLTFDCGYEYKNITAYILDTLKAKNVKAAFFCTLSYLEDNPQLVRRMIDEGHIVGNHSATHPDFTTLTRTQMADELYTFEKYLTENFNYRSEYFRFPGGYHSENTLELVTSLGYTSVFWSVAHKDWETANQPDNNTAFTTVTSRYHSGAVILLHAVSQTNSDILGLLIDDAHSKGYKFKTLDEYIG